MEPGGYFIEQSRHYLLHDYLPKILLCLDELNEDAVWWRPNEKSNSIGNLVLHLCGNVGQWIISGVGGAADVRRRHEEFAEQGPVPIATLRMMLTQRLKEVDEVLAGLDLNRLLESVEIQGFNTTLMGAIYHATEHFSTHVGQIIYITKLHSGQDMAFYEITPDGKAKPRWLSD